MGSFADLIDFDKLHTELNELQKKKDGKELSQEQWEAIETTCKDQLTHRTNSFIGDLGTSIVNLIYRALAGLKNLFNGITGGSPSPSDDVNSSANKTDAYERDQVTQYLYLKLKENPLTREYATAVSGQYPVSETSEIIPPDNIYSQITNKRHIPAGTTAKLNRNIG